MLKNHTPASNADSPVKAVKRPKAAASARRPRSILKQVFAGLRRAQHQRLREELLVEMLFEQFGRTLEQLPLVEAGRLDAKALRGKTGFVAGMGFLHRKSLYRQALGPAPLWLEHLPLHHATSCLRIAINCNCALPVDINGLFIHRER